MGMAEGFLHTALVYVRAPVEGLHQPYKPGLIHMQHSMSGFHPRVGKRAFGAAVSGKNDAQPQHAAIAYAGWEAAAAGVLQVWEG